MSSRRSSRPVPAPAEDDLLLPRAPGVFRRFWARHPLLSDILIAIVCLLLSTVPVASTGGSGGSGVNGGGSSVSGGPWVAWPWLVVATCVLFVWRRRWPLAVFAATIVASAAAMVAQSPVTGVLVMVAAYTVAVYRSARACTIALASGIGALAVFGTTLAALGPTDLRIALNVLFADAVMGLIGALVGVNVGNRKRYVEAIIARSRQLLLERDQQAQLAAASERERIAREMHDVVAHSLTVVVALTEGAAATGDGDRAREASSAAAEVARGALTEMRGMLGVLRGDDPDAPLAPTTPADPVETVASAQRAGYPVTLATTGPPVPPGPVAFAVGRIVQEGLTNAMRHAPHATAATVRIGTDDDAVAVEIVNDAAPASPAHGGGFGLRGIAERAAHVGGTVVSAPDGAGRWVLRARLPIPRTDGALPAADPGRRDAAPGRRAAGVREEAADAGGR